MGRELVTGGVGVLPCSLVPVVWCVLQCQIIARNSGVEACMPVPSCLHGLAQAAGTASEYVLQHALS